MDSRVRDSLVFLQDALLGLIRTIKQDEKLYQLIRKDTAYLCRTLGDIIEEVSDEETSSCN